MKIYPSKHRVISAKKINKNFDIPLAYIDSNSSELKVDIKCAEQEQERRIILPYETFNNLDVIFFDESGEEVNTLDVLRRNDKTKKYYYIPKHSTTYDPQRFNYKILAEKKIKYNTSSLYNMEVICTDLNFAKHIIQIFGDAPKRKLCPSNISVNYQTKNPMFFLNDKIKGDIAFISSDDGIHYKGTDTIIDFEKYLEKHVNVWLITDTVENNKFILDNEKDYYLISPIIYNKQEKSTFKKVLDNDTIINTEFYKALKNSNVINLFNQNTYPVGIIKINKKGIVAVSSPEIFSDLKNNTKLIYEIMMYMFCNSYVQSNSINTWITDDNPDYVVENGKIIKKDKISNPIDVSKIFSIPKDQINICDITTDAPNIIIDDITSSYVVFKKNMDQRFDSYKDGFHKPVGAKTVFTLRQNIMCYEDFLYLLTDNLKDKISYVIKNDKVYIKVEPFKNSLQGINIKDPTFLELPLYKTKNYKQRKVNKITYYLYCQDNVLNVIDSELYSQTKVGNILSEIKIEKAKTEPKIFDIRQRGGGSADSDENYDLLDVGNVLGRPYRKAGSIIITLPKKYEKYKTIIEEAIEKHKVAEEYYIVLFED